jgi:hypothetical protein
MIYQIEKKEESAAAEVLYGPGARRYALHLVHAQVNGKPDGMTSTLYVDAATFAKYGIGDKVHIGLDFVLAEPSSFMLDLSDLPN